MNPKYFASSLRIPLGISTDFFCLLPNTSGFFSFKTVPWQNFAKLKPHWPVGLLNNPK